MKLDDMVIRLKKKFSIMRLYFVYVGTDWKFSKNFTYDKEMNILTSIQTPNPEVDEEFTNL